MTTEDILKDAYLAPIYATSPQFFFASEAYNATNKTLQQNIEALEEQHKLLFATLALANNSYVNMWKKFIPAFNKLKAQGLDYTKSLQYKSIVALGVTIMQKANDWYVTQAELETKAKIKKSPIGIHDFLLPTKSQAILNYANTFFKKGISGAEINRAMLGGAIGSPVIAIVWAAAIITAGISLAYIVSRLTVSTKDRIDLLNATKKACVDLKLTPEECSKVITVAQVEETHNSQGVTDATDALGSTFGKLFLYGLLGFFGYQIITHKKTAA